MEVMNMAKVCPQCGSEYEGKECPFCGYVDEEPKEEQSEEAPQEEQPVEEGGESLELEDPLADLGSEFGDLEQELNQMQQESVDYVENNDGYANDFPDWYLLPPK